MPNSPRPRRTRAELRNLLLDAGAELVRSQGAGVGGANLTYKAVFDHVANTRGVTVTRGSVHERIWDNLSDFQLDVLRHVAATERLTNFGGAVDAAEGAILTEDEADTLDTEAALRAALRVGSTTFLDAPEADGWRAWLSAVSVFAVANSHDSAAREARHVVVEQYDSMREKIVEPLREFLRHLDLRPRADLFGEDREAAESVAYPLLATMLHTCAEGANLRREIDTFDIDNIELPTGPAGEHERWDSVGLQALALVSTFFTRG